MQTNRDIKQSEAFNTWCGNPKSTLNLCTGAGKTKIALMCIQKVFDKIGESLKCLIIVPTEIIRDEVFPSEFKKFGYSHLLKYCEIKCIQTVYKYEDHNYDLVVVDEIHRILYENGEKDYEYFKFFEKNTYKYILGLSASIDDNRLEALNRIAPIIYKLSLDEAVRLGIISPFKIYNVAISLSQEELKEYNRLIKLYYYYESLLGGRFKAFSNALNYINNGSDEEKKLSFVFRNVIKKRKEILDNASGKIETTKKILTYFPSSYGIIFSESIIQAGKLVEANEKALVYHSKLKKPEKLLALKKLNDKRTIIRYISAVKALNEGLSINSIEFSIVTAGNSKVKDMIQRIGRSCRFVEGKQAIVFRLYVKGTQEEKWVRKSQEGFNTNNIYYVQEQDLYKILEELRTI